MRGSGKTYIGKLAASLLGRKFVDADDYFENRKGVSVREYVHEKGWEAFRVAELEILRTLLRVQKDNSIISLGGGIVETSEAREELKKFAGPVVHLVRDVDEILQYLGHETARPAYGEPIEDVYKRRQPWFAECCDFEFVNQTGALQHATDQKGTLAEVERFFGHITGSRPNLAQNLGSGRRSYFLSLTFPDVGPALKHIEELTAGVDALELRVDLLRAPKDTDAKGSYIPPLAYVAQQLSELRRSTSLPIIYTVRTVSQGGGFPDGAEKQAVELLELGLKLGTEYLDVEVTLGQDNIQKLSKRKGASKIIASWHDWSGDMKWDGAAVKDKYDLASSFGDIVKVIGKAKSLDDNLAVYRFAQSKKSGKLLIAISMGEEGKMSRILNPTLSPVTHPLLPSKAAPGQLSFAEIQQALSLLGQLPPQRYCIFGSPITYSPSPLLHNTGFRTLGLPHQYSLREASFITEEVKATLTAPDFGGASVTIPLKIDIMPLLDQLSPVAQAIGSVNTIIPIGVGSSRKLYGDNTDWIGVREALRNNMAPSTPLEAALVIGAGGTARAALYAVRSLGVKRVYIFNRTQGKAKALVTALSDIPIEVVDTLGSWPSNGPSPTVIVSTVPANATSLQPTTSGAVHLTELLFTADQGVVLDAAYKPAETPLLTLAKRSAGWKTVRGVEMLLEQGYAQFEAWTSRRCPRSAVRSAVMEKYEQL